MFQSYFFLPRTRQTKDKRSGAVENVFLCCAHILCDNFRRAYSGPAAATYDECYLLNLNTHQTSPILDKE